jgi:membrane protein
VLWVFVRFQIGVAKANRVRSGLAAAPVFLLWLFASWYAVLVGAEIAIGHGLDRLLVHGVRSWWLDADGQQAAGVAIMVRTARAAREGEVSISLSTLARELRLFPSVVHPVCRALVARGLLVETALTEYGIGCDPDQVTVGQIVEGLSCDPLLGQARDEIIDDLNPKGRSALSVIAQARAAPQATVTLRELAQE